MKTKCRIIVNVVLIAISLSVVFFYLSEENEKNYFEIVPRTDYINIGKMKWIDGVLDQRGHDYLYSKCEFAGRIWNKINLSDKVKNEELHNGELIYYLESSTDTVNHRFGDFVSLRVYNISNELGLEEFDIIPDSFLNDKYLSLAKRYINDDKSHFCLTNKFKPNIALESPIFKSVGSFSGSLGDSFIKEIIVLTNRRAYHFLFLDDRFDFTKNISSDEIEEKFDKIISVTDFNEYKESEEEIYQNKLALDDVHSYCKWVYSLVVLLLFSSVYVSFVNKDAIRNKLARKTSAYFAYTAIILILALFIFCVLSEDYSDKTKALLLSLAIIPIYNAFIISLNVMAGQDYVEYYLIPSSIKRAICRGSGVISRLLLLFFFFPLYYLCPIPVGGWFVFVFYILPMFLFLAFIFSIRYVITWIIGDKNVIDSVHDISSTKQKRFCRHCGKPIDPSARFCRHCGKEV